MSDGKCPLKSHAETLLIPIVLLILPALQREGQADMEMVRILQRSSTNISRFNLFRCFRHEVEESSIQPIDRRRIGRIPVGILALIGKKRRTKNMVIA